MNCSIRKSIHDLPAIREREKVSFSVRKAKAFFHRKLLKI